MKRPINPAGVWPDILFDIRRERGLTRKGLAQLTGISSNTIENYENNNTVSRELHRVEALLDAMGYDLEAIKRED
jgi:transcriptional regulator with XRE-family HTH domain